MEDRKQWLVEQRQELLAQQSRAIKAKRLLGNEDYKELILDQMKGELDNLYVKLSSPSDLMLSEKDKLSGVDAVRYLQGQIRTTKGLIAYLENIVLIAEGADSELSEIEAELETITGQPADNL